jgi:hypothetical protein
MVVNGMDVLSFAIKVPPCSLLEFVEHLMLTTLSTYPAIWFKFIDNFKSKQNNCFGLALA